MDLQQALTALESLATGQTVSRGEVIEAAKVVTAANKARKLVKPPKTPLAAPTEFDRFWDKYPRKIGKKAAMKAWKKANPGLDLVALIMQSLERHCGKWQGKDEEFIPHASSWLNGERWIDVLPVAKQPDMGADPIYKNWPYSKPTNRPETTQEYRTRMDAMRRV